MVAILSFQREAILGAVQAMYTEVATHPEKGFHFPTGRAACVFVGYPTELLDRLPATALESFAGVGFPFAADCIRPADVVLDVGSGSGTDTLIASLLAGPSGRALGLDLTEAMLRKLERNAVAAGVSNVECVRGNAEEIPLPPHSVDVVTSNGVLNLVPDKPRAMREIFRVLRPGGRLQIADIVLRNPASDACRARPELWAECVVGATVDDVYLGMLRAAGFHPVEVLSHFDYFSGSASPETRAVASSLGAHAIVMRAARPA
jgi:SAM-dependent methyltransferase